MTKSVEQPEGVSIAAQGWSCTEYSECAPKVTLLDPAKRQTGALLFALVIETAVQYGIEPEGNQQCNAQDQHQV